LALNIAKIGGLALWRERHVLVALGNLDIRGIVGSAVLSKKQEKKKILKSSLSSAPD
jgi:hypothetical protein